MAELCSVFRATSDPSVIYYWMYAVAFTLHIYFDFSGYSDMAIGLGNGIEPIPNILMISEKASCKSAALNNTKLKITINMTF